MALRRRRIATTALGEKRGSSGRPGTLRAEKGEAMTEFIACKICIATKGLKGSDLAGQPRTNEELYRHIEQEHHMPVRRENETEDQCMARFERENPDATGENCRCPACGAVRQTKAKVDEANAGLVPS